MPPPGSPPQSNTGQNYTGNVEPYYSNEDVAILHDIVVLAQELLPKLPERERLPTNALFSAYYNILPRTGINADHDSRYARVLFKIGGLRGAGTLYEKFEEILSRMGIEIEFDHGNDDDEEEYSQLETSQNELEVAASNRPVPNDEKKLHRLQRRNSESSAWDLGIDLQSQSRTRRNSISTVGKDRYGIEKPDDILQDVPSGPLPSRSNIVQPSNPNKVDSNRNIGAWLEARSPEPRRDRARSVSTHGSMRVRRRSTSAGYKHHPYTLDPSVHASEGYFAESEHTGETSNLEEAFVAGSGPVQPDHESTTLLDMKASLMQQQRREHSAARYFWHWRQRALQLRKDIAELDLIAIDHDKTYLLRSALDSWHMRIIENNQVAETERFFDHLERRAAKARGLYLLHTAFTHWSNFANEHVQRTALARRHIVRTRIFNAWKDITAVNQLKVRRQVLKKFFSVWKRQYSSISAQCVTALQKYEENLAEKVYSRWARKLRDIKAQNWWAEATKRRTLFRWIVVSHSSWESRRSAEEMRRLNLMWNAWKVWRDQIEVQICHNHNAETYHRDTLLRVSLKRWRRETRVVPAKITVQSDVATRRLRWTFRIWAHHACQEREAAAIDRLRMLREAVTIWRHKSRYQLISSRVDYRIVAQALHRWIIRERTTYALQTLSQRRLRCSFQSWLHRLEDSRRQSWDQEDVAQSFAARKAQNTVLRNWYSRMELTQRREVTAANFHTPRFVQGLVSKWSAQTRHLKELQRMSRNAEFYFVASKALKRWKASTEAAKREKRKAAYTQVRRMTKLSLVRGILQTWGDQARHILNLHAQALNARQNKDVIIGMDVFDRWRARTEELAELESLWKENVLKKQFTIWRERSDSVKALATEAVITYQEIRQSRVVKKWSLQTLQVRAQTNYAAEIREKNAKKNFRRILSYWHQKALQRRPRYAKVETVDSHQLGTTARAEAWSEFGEEHEMDEWARGVDDGAASTPIPGYLSTPSKRSERVMAVAARYTTTPKAPLSTPFERRLRAQWSGGPSTNGPLGRRKSTLGMDRGFADISEG